MGEDEPAERSAEGRGLQKTLTTTIMSQSNETSPNAEQSRVAAPPPCSATGENAGGCEKVKIKLTFYCLEKHVIERDVDSEVWARVQAEENAVEWLEKEFRDHNDSDTDISTLSYELAEYEELPNAQLRDAAPALSRPHPTSEGKYLTP